MKSDRPRWTLRHWLLAIAILAVAYAVLGVGGTISVAALVSPALIAPAGRRLAAMYWVAVFYPFFVLFSLFAAYAAPRGDGTVGVGEALPMALTLATPLALMIIAIETMYRARRRTKEDGSYEGGSGSVALFVIVPVAWISGWILIGWDPWHVLDWYMD